MLGQNLSSPLLRTIFPPFLKHGEKKRSRRLPSSPNPPPSSPIHQNLLISSKGKKGRGRDDRNLNENPLTGYDEIVKENDKFSSYYREQSILPDDEEFSRFWASL